MRFKVDENLPVEACDLLRRAGYDADTVADEHLAGSDDAAVAQVLLREQRSLITLDLDFGDLRAYPPRQYHGLVVIRSKRQDKPTLLSRLRQCIGLLESEPLEGRLWIVEADRIRIHE